LVASRASHLPALCLLSATTAIYSLSLHDALPILDPAFRPSEEQSPDPPAQGGDDGRGGDRDDPRPDDVARQAPANLLVSGRADRSEEHTSELQSRENLVCRLLLEKKKNTNEQNPP